MKVSEDVRRSTAIGSQIPTVDVPAALHAVLPAPRVDIALRPDRHTSVRESRAYAALDLGTNNCRLLIARPSRRGFQVVDAFSRIIRLGEGVSTTGRLCEMAMDRTWDALKVCAAKMRRHNVARARLVATEACRAAENGPDFIARVGRGLGLNIEILSREAEAKLAVSGCATLLDDDSDLALVFDIGGGSSELV
jgi:exopolyphosphatase/guanosine-5'-triphosphate,3'-diphosphate pyrophosphatase